VDRTAVALVHGDDAIANGDKRWLTTVENGMQREIGAACLPPEGQRRRVALYPNAMVFPRWVPANHFLKMILLIFPVRTA
jgi:hypothetical protein